MILANSAWSGPFGGPLMVYIALLASVLWMVILLPSGGVGMVIARRRLRSGQPATGSFVFALIFTILSSLGLLMCALCVWVESERKEPLPMKAVVATLGLSASALVYSALWTRMARRAGIEARRRNDATATAPAS